MHEGGYNRTWLQCQRNIKNIKAKYKEAKDHNNRSGQDRITWPFYDTLKQILGDKPSCWALEVLDSLSSENSNTGIKNVDENDAEEGNLH